MSEDKISKREFALGVVLWSVATSLQWAALVSRKAKNCITREKSNDE